MGVQRLAPLAQRLAVDYATDARFDNPRAVQIRLRGFSLDSLDEVGRKVRDLYAGPVALIACCLWRMILISVISLRR